VSTLPKENKMAFDGISFARALPHQPGVYRFYNAAGKLLYVGKAKDLQKRVSSYFQKNPEDPRIALMVENIARAEFTVVPTEIDALVLESRLIKEEKPHYNVQLRDGSGYPYLHLSTDKEIPQLRVHRGKRGKTGRYFGPFPSREAVYGSHDLLQKHFGLRTCSDSFFSHRSRPCLEFQIGRCTAPCVGIISTEDYKQRVKELELLLEGKSDALVQDMQERMERASLELDFESAAQWRDRITSLRHVQSKVSVEMGEGSFDAIAIAQESGIASVSIVTVRNGQVVGVKDMKLSPPWDTSNEILLGQVIAQHYLEGDAPVPAEILASTLPEDHAALETVLSGKRKVSIRTNVRNERKIQLDLAVNNAKAGLDASLQSRRLWDQRWDSLVHLLRLPERPKRIECFDISHTMGQATVASCVVFGPAGPTKSAYRRYNISGITPGDDYAAMRQAVERRLRGNPMPPDLLLIDGGTGQVAQAVDIARGMGLLFPIVGVSKGPERRAGDEDLIVDDGKREIHPGPSSPALHLIQAVRDEAHRFAIEGHRRRRERAATTSVLERIPNVGPARRQALLNAFGGIQGLKQATVEAIAQVPGIGKDLAEQIAIALRS
jgi:excinuclease ABC subunit C